MYRKMTNPRLRFIVSPDGEGGGGAAGGADPTEQDASKGDPAPTFTQADVDRIVRERVQRERGKYADYDDLKAKAGQAATAEERIADLEKAVATAQREALVRRVQAKHSIADEDAALFLTGPDEDTLTAQAERLAERLSTQQQKPPHVSREGHSTRPGEDPMRTFARSLVRREG